MKEAAWYSSGLSRVKETYRMSGDVCEVRLWMGMIKSSVRPESAEGVKITET